MLGGRLRPVGHIIEACAAAAPAEALAVLLPPAVQRLRPGSGSSEEEERCALRVLAKAVKRAGGAAILPHRAELLEVVVRHSARHDAKPVAKEACKLLRCLVHGLASTYTVERCADPVGQNGAPRRPRWRRRRRSVHRWAAAGEWLWTAPS